jgi:hypothetical protein
MVPVDYYLVCAFKLLILTIFFMVIVTEPIVEGHGTSDSESLAGNSHYVDQERLLQDSDDTQAAADLETVPIRDDMGFGGTSSFSDVKGLILTHLCKVTVPGSWRLRLKHTLRR